MYFRTAKNSNNEAFTRAVFFIKVQHYIPVSMNISLDKSIN